MTKEGMTDVLISLIIVLCHRNPEVSHFRVPVPEIFKVLIRLP